MTIIEAQLIGALVLGVRICGISKLIEKGVNGLTFENRMVEELNTKIEQMWNALWDYEFISR